MARRRIQNVLRKEWVLTFTDLNSTLLVTLLPLLIVGQVVVVIWLIAKFGGESIAANPALAGSLARLNAALPATTSLPPVDQLVVMLLSQFNFYLLLIPTMIAISFATFSIVDEKTSGSLEPLLATPVRTWELLLGKALAGAVPALVVTWACAGVFLLALVGLGWGHLLSLVLTTSWFFSLFLLTPVVALLSFLLGIIGSSRAKDAKGAQNIALVIILPVLALIGIQIGGVVWFTTIPTLVLAVAIGVLDLLVLRLATSLFQRESIVVKWR